MGATSFAQTDSVQVERKDDTIRIGGMIILKKGTPDDEKKRVTVTVGNHRRHKENSNISTSSFIFDIGFSDWTDKTNYEQAKADAVLGPDLSANDFKLKTVKQ